MITGEQINLLVEILVRRTQQANIYFLESIGSYIKQIKELSPTKALQLVQILKYGGNYENIVREISKYTNLNIKEIDNIFLNYAKKDQLFYEKFYKYRDIPFIPIDKSYTLKAQALSLANLVKNEMYNYTHTNVLGYSIKDIHGITRFMGLRETYNYALDEALLSVSQGKESFDSSMSRILKEIGGSGLKTLEYASGRSIRLDSAISMHLKNNLHALHNGLQDIYGREFGADGVEITVHGNPAPDHEKVQGRCFSINHYDENGILIQGEFEKLQNGLVAKDYKGKRYSLNEDDKPGYRPISTMNCQHDKFNIILGVSEPEYNDEQLNDIIEKNEKGFEFEGKHYTMYEGEQLQRRIETEVRRQKDIQILAKASDNDDLVRKSQDMITKLSNKYKELSRISGLPTKVNRMRVPNYRRKKVN